MTVTFTEENHEYRMDGAVVPSVTEILQPLSDFSRVPMEVLEYKRSLGKAVHKAIELWERQDLDIADLDPAALPYFDGWLKFKKESGFRAVKSELMVWSYQYRYAGPLDIIGHRGETIGEVFSCTELLDVKCVYSIAPETAIQTAAYETALTESAGLKVKKRGAVQLTPEGGFKYFPYRDKGDFNVFLSLLNIHNWRRNHA